jgi:hypothetical protein
MPHLTRLLAPALLLFLTFAALPVSAGVVVLTNRTTAKLGFRVAVGKAIQEVRLEPHEARNFFTPDAIQLVTVTDHGLQGLPLKANGIYAFVVKDGKVDLAAIALPGVPANAPVAPMPPVPAVPVKPADRPGGSGATPAARPDAAPAARPDDRPKPRAIVTVKLLVDEEEPTVQRLWEKKLKDRLRDASDILEPYSGVRFEAVAVERWISSNTITDFNKSLAEFEEKVKPAPARLAIGFTSQYRIVKPGTLHMGGTRGPLASHVLIREWSQHATHLERVEILVHELGHFLGAAHTTETNSVMRPSLADHQVHAKGFRIAFDAGNAFLLGLVGEELAAGRGGNLGQIHPFTRRSMLGAYRAMHEALPHDRPLEEYVEVLSKLDPAPAPPK